MLQVFARKQELNERRDFKTSFFFRQSTKIYSTKITKIRKPPLRSNKIKNHTSN